MKKSRVFIYIKLFLAITIISGCNDTQQDYNSKMESAKSLISKGKFKDALDIMNGLDSLTEEDRKLYNKTISDYASDYINKKTEEEKRPPLDLLDLKTKRKGNYYYASAAVKNNGRQIFKYIKVKVTYFDENENVVDTDWAYAVDSEGLRPGEQKYFEIMTKYRSEMKTNQLSVIDFEIVD